MEQKEKDFWNNADVDMMFADIIGLDTYREMKRHGFSKPKLLDVAVYKLFTKPDSLEAKRYTERVRSMCLRQDAGEKIFA